MGERLHRQAHPRAEGTATEVRRKTPESRIDPANVTRRALSHLKREELTAPDDSIEAQTTKILKLAMFEVWPKHEVEHILALASKP